MKKRSKRDLLKAIFGSFFIVIGMLAGAMGTVLTSDSVYADPESSESVRSDEIDNTETNNEEVNIDSVNTESENNTGLLGTSVGMIDESTCKASLGEISWLVCPTTGKIAEAVDWLYEKLEGILVIDPISMEDGSPIYEIWKYCLGLANIVFIIFLLVMVYSQITGLGISNYGIKKVLPKLIVTAILINLSFLICALAVDLSNVIGSGLRGVFKTVEESVILNNAAGVGTLSGQAAIEAKISAAKVYSSMAGGATLAVLGGVVAFETGAIWMLIPVVLGAVVAVISGLITVAMRQAVVVLLVMIAPLAIVAYILPNTEKWFKKWKDLLMKMLIFYPMFSLLFGASSLAGFAIVSSAKDGFGVLLGIAVQIFPLFFSWSLMKMSGTFLGTINTKISGLATKPLATNRAWAESHRLNTKQKFLASNRPVTPSLRLMQFVSNRRIARETEIDERAAEIKERGLAYRARRNYRNKDIYGGVLSKKGEEAYARQARIMEYQGISLRNKNNFNKGFSQLAKEGTATHDRLLSLDMANVNASDKLKMEQARGEKIDFDNAVGFHERMEAAMNANADKEYGYKNGQKRSDYRFHFDDEKAEAEASARYSVLNKVMEGNVVDMNFAAATAAQSYDTHKKIMESKMQKYYELTAPTKDIEYRLADLTTAKDAAKNMDFIVPGLRILNQRGDTDLLKKQLDNLLNKNIGGGITLGTHASQSLASFLMFEVKDNDPFLRRFGKYINLETANAYNENRRKGMNVTYDEYVRGYHEEPDGTRMYAKKGMKQLVEGTSLDNIERTALSNLDDSLKKAYGYDENNKGKKWDVDGYLKKRKEIQEAMEPAFLSASLKWLSGSEQINSGVKFWTGYELKQRKDGNGNIVTDKNGNPEYDLMPVWNGEEFDFENKDGKSYKDVMKEYYQDKTKSYIKDQTTGQILGMRTDYRGALIEHFADMFLKDSSKDLPSSKRRADYDKAASEINARYKDKSPKEAEELRKKDLEKLKTNMAKLQIRKVLGETGKLEQIYRTRRSGAANNAKDWWREWIGLDDEEAMYREVKYYEDQRRQQAIGRPVEDSVGSDDGMGRIYDEQMRADIRNDLDKIWEDNRDVSGGQFYDVAIEAIKGWFGAGGSVVEKKFEDYYEQLTSGSGNPDAYDLKKYLDDLLHDPDNYPDA